jgi:uncharacterized protein
MSCVMIMAVAVMAPSLVHAVPMEPVPPKVPARLPDAADLLSPSQIHLGGWLGARIDANEKNRLLRVDTEPLLAGYRKRPGSHPWIGEHIGKWLHAATLAWAYTSDEALKYKLDKVVADLIACQEPDGYLGTYAPEKRFGLYPGADWDVWSHKYNLIGLLTYYQYTGNEKALDACRKMGDLLIATFPGKKSILAAGTHVGMAATSVLEPIVLLYRFTGDRRYLEFAKYLVKAWDEPGGPKIIASLLTQKKVNKTANSKAYEMLSNLVGLCELARATGDRMLLEPVTNAWNDIVENRLYITGSASAGEHFQDDHALPTQVGANIGETCVTTTWIQLNLQLLRLTAYAKYGDELERSFYNHLAAAQHPRGDDWCYYTALEGKKPYDPGINCCHSSGPRGMALAVQAAYLKIKAGENELMFINSFEDSRVELELNGQKVSVSQSSQFPRAGVGTLTFHMAKPATFGLLVRVPKWVQVPPWTSDFKLTASGQTRSSFGTGGIVIVQPREWKDGDTVRLDYKLGPRLITGHFGNTNHAALAWGPFVLAYDQARNPGLPAPGAIGLVDDTQSHLVLEPGQDLVFRGPVVGRDRSGPRPAIFVPFADAGSTGGVYRVWLRAPGVVPASKISLLADGEESRSRRGNQHGSIIDDDPSSIVVTFNGRPAKEDWYAVTLAQPAEIKRVVFMHGQSFEDGGWFDTRGGKPRVQIQQKKGGPWETIGELSSYPATTATERGGIEFGQAFELLLDRPVEAVAVRVIGVPSCGNNPKQAFSSSGELQAFAD